MALNIALDAYTQFNRTGTADPDTVSHPGVTPDMVLMLSVSSITTNYHAGMTYAGITVPLALQIAGGTRYLNVGFLASKSIPAGTQNAVFDYTSATGTDIWEYVVTMRSGSAADLVLIDSDISQHGGTIPNSSLSLQTTGRTCQGICGAIVSLPDLANVVEGAGLSLLGETDRGASVSRLHFQTTPSLADWSPSYTHAASQAEIFALTFREYFDTALLGNATTVEGSVGTTTITFPVIRAPAELGTASTVDWAVTGSGAHPANATDFNGGVFPSGTLSFGTTDEVKVISVAVVPDDTNEFDETFTVTISNPSAGSITTATAVGTILNDDCDIAATCADTTKIPSETPFVFNVARTGYVGGTSGVLWVIEGISPNPVLASIFPDGILPSGVVSFAASETLKTVNVTFPTTGSGANGVMDFAFRLSSPAQGATITSGDINGQITYPTAPTIYSITATDAVKAEG